MVLHQWEFFFSLTKKFYAHLIQPWEVTDFIFLDLILVMCTHISCILWIFMFEKQINLIRFDNFTILCSFNSSSTHYSPSISFGACGNFGFPFFIPLFPFPSLQTSDFSSKNNNERLVICDLEEWRLGTQYVFFLFVLSFKSHFFQCSVKNHFHLWISLLFCPLTTQNNSTAHNFTSPIRGCCLHNLAACLSN